MNSTKTNGMKFEVAGSAQDTILNRAILLYEKKNGYNDTVETLLATIHDIRNVGTVKRPNVQVLPGQPITQAALFGALKSMSEKYATDAEILPEALLSFSHRHLMWWMPAQKKHVFFNAQSIGKRSAVVPHPALLFVVADQTWSVYAMNESKRPTNDTKLFNAPYFNVWDSHQICVGSASIPDNRLPSTIPTWESAFFDSEFTHTNGTAKRTSHALGPYGFWTDMLDGKHETFPTELLVGAEKTVGSIVTSLNRVAVNG